MAQQKSSGEELKVSKEAVVDEPKKEKKPAVVYFRNPKYAKESVVFGQEKHETGKTVFERERFEGFVERVRGDFCPVGYLATSNKKVIDVLRAKTYVEEISEKEYSDATTGKKVQRF